MTSILIKKENSETDTHTQGECHVKMISKAQTPIIARKPPAARKEGWADSLGVLKRNHTASTLILDFQPPELCNNKFLLFKLPSTCGIMLWQSYQNNIVSYYFLMLLQMKLFS